MTEPPKGQKKSRLLPWIGAERAVIALTLLALGIVILVNLHADLGKDVTSLSKYFGIDPASNGIQSLSGSARKLTPDRLSFYGVVAIAYGSLEAVEAYGLIRRRRWGEYVTVLGTALLFVPEVYELFNDVSILKIALLLLNVAVVVYLVVHLRRTRSPRERASGPAKDDWMARFPVKVDS